jgi:hypothetical protein
MEIELYYLMYHCHNRTIKKVPMSAYNFFFLNLFYTHQHSNKLCSNTHYLIICFKMYLCSIGRVRNASDADIYVIFPLLFFFFTGILI